MAMATERREEGQHDEDERDPDNKKRMRTLSTLLTDDCDMTGLTLALKLLYLWEIAESYKKR